MKLKRFLFVFPLIFVFLLPFTIPRFSYAWGSSEIDGNYVLTGRSENLPSRLYAYFDTVDESTGQTVYHSITFNVGNTVDNGGATVTYNDGVWKFTITGNDTVWVRQKYNFENPRNGDYVTQETYEYIKVIELNLNERSVSFYRVNGSTISSTPSLSANVDDNNLQIKECTIFDFDEFPEGDLEVYFPIPLEGDIYQTIHSNEYNVDVQAYQFDCQITNNTSKNYQVMWCILDEGESVNFDFDSSSSNTALSGVNGYGFNGNPSWVQLENRYFCGFSANFSHSAAWRDEYGEFNNNSITTYLTSLSAIPSGIVARICGPCSWSFVGAGQSLTLRSCVKNMELFSGHHYTCKVYAIETPYNYITNIDKALGDLIYSENSDNPYICYLDFSDTECVYSSNFTMRFNTDFQEDWNGSGIISYSPNINPDRLFNSTISAEYDDGSLDNTYRVSVGTPSINPYNGYNPSGYSSDYSGANKYTSFVKDSSSVFKFFSLVFGYFPLQITNLYYLGFWSIIILAILRRIH